MASVGHRKAIRLQGEALMAAEKLIEMKRVYSAAREEILSRYEAEMAVFAAKHNDEVQRLFGLVHSSTDTDPAEGWVIDGTEEGIRLEPVVAENAAAAMISRHATRQRTH